MMMTSRTKIVVYSHGVLIYPGNNTAKEALLEYSYTLAQYSFQKKPPTWRMQKVITKVYASWNKTRTEFRFHVNLLDDLFKALDYKGIKRNMIEVEHMKPSMGDPIDFTKNSLHTLRDYQNPIADHLSVPNLPIKVTNLQTGRGKAVKNSCPVRTPSGWVPMGDIKLGDKVVSQDGSSTKVTGVYPQGELPMNLITFNDGRSIECCDEHLWECYRPNWGTHGGEAIRTVNTTEMKRIMKLSNSRLYIPYVKPELREDTPESRQIDECIPPYVLGALLGDGSLSNGTVNVSNFDIEVKEMFRGLIDSDLRIVDRNDGTFAVSKRDDLNKNKWTQYLRYLDLMGKRSWEKHIPRLYLEGSFKQRIELIQGMMDTDGTAGTDGRFTYTTTSKQMAEDFQYLVRSVGGWAKISSRYTHYTYNNIKKRGRLAYTLSLKYRTPEDFFTLPRKRNRVSNDSQYNNAWLKVESIVDSKAGEATCISVDHPSKLFVVKDFIVTHNTLIALTAMARLGVRTAINLRGGYVDRWIPDLKEFFNLGKGELLVIRGRDALLSLINMAVSKDPDLDRVKVIIFTSKTIYNYIKEFDLDPNNFIYQVRPENLYEILGVGLKIVDELHEDYHLNFKSDIYSNVANGIYLSATLDTKDPFRNRMYNIAHPPDTWLAAEYDAYVEVRAKNYTMVDLDSVRTTQRGDVKYSHTAYEASILKNPTLRENYCKIIYESFAYEFFTESPYEPGQKAMIFCSTVDMCNVVRDYLLTKTVDLTVEVFVAGVPTKILLHSDIVVTTVESAGTAVDVKGLKVVCLTRALDKFEKNEQIKGRLRKMSPPWEDVRPILIYLNNVLVEKHMTYHANKLKFWKKLVHSHKTYTLETRL
jgi:hypothetical protein